MDFTVTHVNVYRFAQRLKETCPYAALAFVVSGVERYLMDGVDLRGQVPLFVLARKGAAVDVELNASRENWVVMLEGIDFTPTSSRDTLEVSDGKRTLLMPRAVGVPQEFVVGWRSEFELMRKAWLDPTPRNRFRIETGVMNVFRHMLDAVGGSPRETPAGTLKKMIDADQGFQFSVEDLSRQCGYSSDHLRLLFKREFNTTPGKYREGRRMMRAMEYVANSALSVKEIAVKLGFAQLPAFSTCFKLKAGLSPSAAIARYRIRR